MAGADACASKLSAASTFPLVEMVFRMLSVTTGSTLTSTSGLWVNDAAIKITATPTTMITRNRFCFIHFIFRTLNLAAGSWLRRRWQEDCQPTACHYFYAGQLASKII